MLIKYHKDSYRNMLKKQKAMFALASRGEGGAAAPFTANDVILRARPQTACAR